VRVKEREGKHLDALGADAVATQIQVCDCAFLLLDGKAKKRGRETEEVKGGGGGGGGGAQDSRI
jgi:hypothetical protein